MFRYVLILLFGVRQGYCMDDRTLDQKVEISALNGQCQSLCEQTTSLSKQIFIRRDGYNIRGEVKYLPNLELGDLSDQAFNLEQLERDNKRLKSEADKLRSLLKKNDSGSYGLDETIEALNRQATYLNFKRRVEEQ